MDIKSIARKVGIFLFDKQLKLGIKKPINHILVINWYGKIGDAIVSSFFFREVRKVKNLTISVVTTEELKSLYINHYNVDSVYTVKNKFIYFELFKIAQHLKHVDTIIPLMGRLNFKDLFFISRIQPNNLFSLDDEIGLSNIQMGQFANKLLAHEIYFFVLRKIGVNHVNDSFIIPTSDKKKSTFDIIFNPFGSREDKSLSIRKSVDLLNLIAKEYPDKSIGIANSPNTKTIAIKISKQVNYKNVSTINNINSLYDIINNIQNASIVISVDTSIVHISSGLHINTIAIYYGAEIAFNRWLPKKSPNTTILYSNGNEHDTLKNMNNVKNYQVINAIKKLSKDRSQHA